MRTAGRVVERVRKVVLDHTNSLPSVQILVAFSGGADSTCLLDALRSVAPNSLRAACHVDHGLRDSSEDEMTAVSAMCEWLSVEIVHEAVDTTTHMTRTGKSVELAARELRYLALRRTARTLGAGIIATGHTADDQVETVLMHEFRGAGLAGISGMKILTEDLFRPLLSVTHEETVAYCHARKLEFLEDESNQDERMTRNRLRRSILPQLRESFPGVSKAVLRLSESAMRDTAYMENQATEARAFVVDDTGVIVPELWSALSPAIGYHLLRLLRESAGEPLSSVLLSQDVARLNRALIHATAGSKLSEDAGEILPAFAQGCFESPLRVPGRTMLNGLMFDVVLRDEASLPREEIPLATRMVAYLDARKSEGIQVRAWRQGDRMTRLGMAGSRKVQDIFVDYHVPAELRMRVPIVESESGVILWIPGVALGQAARVTPESSSVLHVAVRHSAAQ